MIRIYISSSDKLRFLGWTRFRFPGQMRLSRTDLRIFWVLEKYVGLGLWKEDSIDRAEKKRTIYDRSTDGSEKKRAYHVFP